MQPNAVFLELMNQPWFFAIDLIGTVAFAISGLLVAYKERVSLFGAFVMAALPAVGGGIMRDLLIQRQLIGIFRNPIYIQLVWATTLASYLIIQYTPFLKSLLLKKLSPYLINFVEVCDALGVAAFTVIGVVISSVHLHVTPLWLWSPLLAALTVAGGGVLRDVLRTDRYIFSFRGAIYPEIALFWGFVFALFIECNPLISHQRAQGIVLFVLIAAFFSRLLAHYCKWKNIRYRSSVF